MTHHRSSTVMRSSKSTIQISVFTLCAICGLVGFCLLYRAGHPGPLTDATTLRPWHMGPPGRRIFGFVDTAGQWAIRPQFDAASDFSEGLALVRIRGDYRFITASAGVQLDRMRKVSGELVPSSRWSSAGLFREQHAAVVVGQELYFIDRDGVQTGAVGVDAHKLIGPGIFPLPVSLSDGLAAVPADGKYGAVDCHGLWVIQPKFDSLWEFGRGLAIVRGLPGPVKKFWGNFLQRACGCASRIRLDRASQR